MHGRSLLLSAVVALSLAACGYGDAPAFDLCIEQSPAKAGKVTPDSGTHRVSADSLVTLAAEPRPGYQFAYWLGDVTDPTARQTTVHVNSPKVIVAVFKPAEKDPFDRQAAGGGGGGGDMLALTAVDFSSPDWSPSGGSKRDTTDIPTIHTPEPATLAILVLGALALRRRTHSYRAA
jgi:hypothetical protein